MAMVKFEDEKDLQRKICDIINKGGYNFKKERDGYFCDVVDYNIKAFGEVKTNGKFAPQQILYGIAKNDVRDARYLILANEFELRVFEAPDFDAILSFAKEISPDLSRAPSSVTEMKHVNRGFKILGTHLSIYTYKGTFKIDEKQPCIFLDDSNYEYFQLILQKYRINPAEFINKFATTWAAKSRLFIKNDDATIFDQESGNEVKAHRKVTNEFDRMLIRSMRIKAENVEKIIHKIDALSPIDVRRKRGKYWSNLGVSEIAVEIVRDLVNPTFVFEPFVGGGSLVRDLVPDVPGVANDIDGEMVSILEQEFEGYDWKFHKKNFLTTPVQDMIDKWGIPKETERFLIYTNPPFGTASTNKLASKIGEVEESRKNEIQYGSPGEEKYFGDTYGRGDLCIPAIAHMIEIIKKRGNGYLAFFSPFGVMLGRSRYNKVLKALLKDFEFLYGEVFSGAMFNGVNAKKSISFTIWNYSPNIHTKHEDLVFISENVEYKLKKMNMLKDGWKYINNKTHTGEIVVNRNDCFNNPNAKRMIHLRNDLCGSEMITENVKRELNIEKVPSELLYAMWSMTVGYKAIYEMPFVFNECIVHLPDFTIDKTLEICTLSLMYAIITELMNNNCQGKIGFIGMNRIFKFGGERLTKGANYLIDTYGDCPVGPNETIGSVFAKLKDGKDPDGIDKKLRIYIREEIQKRLDTIGYWNYLPIPDIGSNDDD